MPRITEKEAAKMILGGTDDDGLWEYDYISGDIKYLQGVGDVWIVADRKI